MVDKVKSHCTILDVLEGKLPLRDYIGNTVADLAAKAACAMCGPSELVLRYAEQHATLAYLICVRLAIAEAIHLAALSNVHTLQVRVASAPIAAHVYADSLKRLLQQSGHVLFRLPNGKFRCNICGATKSRMHFKQWIAQPCVSGTPGDASINLFPPATCKAVAGTAWGQHRLVRCPSGFRCVLCCRSGPLSDFSMTVGCDVPQPPSPPHEAVIEGTFDQFRKVQNTETFKQRKVNTINARTVSLVASAAVSQISCCPPAPVLGEQPPRLGCQC